jgi:gluconolactonase
LAFEMDMILRFGILSRVLAVIVLFWQAMSPAQTQVHVAQTSQCVSANPVAPAQGGVGGALDRGEETRQTPRKITVTDIPRVVSGGKWTKIWQAPGNSADGILSDPDGSVLIAQEDYDTVLRIDENGNASVAVTNAKGVGALSMDREGNLYGAHRTERSGSTKPDKDSIVNAITVLAPKSKTIADKWVDGTTLTVRPNDLAADSHGGAYFTMDCLYYANPQGVRVMAANLRTNGITFSPDDKILYVTNRTSLVAFDVKEPGVVTNRRDFATLLPGSVGDGMTVDSEGRLYVSSNLGVQVFNKAGRYLGLIPTERPIISVTFGGPVKKTLYVVGSGADDETGYPIRQGPQRTAATIYKLSMIAQGLKDRAK